MANSLIQFRIEESTRLKATSICERLGMDLPTYMRIAINRLIRDNGIPFSMTLEDKVNEADSRGLAAMKRASRTAKEQEIADMTLEEINAEIAKSRK